MPDFLYFRYFLYFLYFQIFSTFSFRVLSVERNRAKPGCAVLRCFPVPRVGCPQDLRARRCGATGGARARVRACARARVRACLRAPAKAAAG